MSRTYELPHLGGSTISTKITSRLISELKTGIFSQSERLPSETELAEHFSVSRSVIRDAMSNLEGEGFVGRARGVGTIVHRDIVNLKGRVDLKYEYFQLVQDAGGHPSSDGIHLSESFADETLATNLRIEAGMPILICEKRISADGKPVLFSTDYIPRQLFSGMDYHKADWSEPIFDIMERFCGVTVDTDIASFEAVNPPQEIADRLRIPQSSPVIKVDEIGYYKFNTPILFTTAYYTDYFRFTILRKKF